MAQQQFGVRVGNGDAVTLFDVAPGGDSLHWVYLGGAPHHTSDCGATVVAHAVLLPRRRARADRPLARGGGRRVLLVSEPLDPRIADTVHLLLDDPTATPGARGLAARAGGSRSHFLRRFSRETGTSLRRYRLWARMVVVARVIADGGDLTRAAADAGFASPSHCSDTFLRMFGLTASELLGSGAELIIVDDGVMR